MGCFWGAEKLFWEQEGIYSTAVGYMGGHQENPSYKDVCSGLTGHREVVKIVFNPEQITINQLLKIFWENHDPTQGMRQGNDIGSQYQSVIYYDSLDVKRSGDNVEKIIHDTKEKAQTELNKHSLESITTQIEHVKNLTGFNFAEDYHQQYLAKNPNGYCGLSTTGITIEPLQNKEA